MEILKRHVVPLKKRDSQRENKLYIDMGFTRAEGVYGYYMEIRAIKYYENELNVVTEVDYKGVLDRELLVESRSPSGKRLGQAITKCSEWINNNLETWIEEHGFELED